jgi:GH25 family lysozyme M1 (1,4-beta-N-acetylmuramidase)
LDAGLLVGEYQYLRADQSALEQAEVAAPSAFASLPFMLDVEVDSLWDAFPRFDIANLVMEWSELMGCHGIYTNYSSWRLLEEHIPDAIYQRPLWIADFNKRESPKCPREWNSWFIWQQSAKGRVPGIYGDVDINVMNEAYSTNGSK